MSTLSDIVTNAFRWANVIGTDDTPEAAEAADGLRIVNGMFFGMEVDGYVFTTPYIAPDTERGPYTHAEFTLVSDWPFEEGYVEGLTAMLAVRISQLHGESAPPWVGKLAGQGEARIMNAFFTMPDMVAEGPLRRTGRSGVGSSR